MPDLEKRYVFSDAALQGVVDRALASLPKESKGALVLYGEARDGRYAAAVAARKGEHWSMVVGCEKDHDAPLGASAKILYSW
jgi:hypothetical protein